VLCFIAAVVARLDLEDRTMHALFLAEHAERGSAAGVSR
jgi:hypothetical protein